MTNALFLVGGHRLLAFIRYLCRRRRQAGAADGRPGPDVAAS